MPAKKYLVALTPEERQQLTRLTSSGKAAAPAPPPSPSRCPRCTPSRAWNGTTGAVTPYRSLNITCARITLVWLSVSACRREIRPAGTRE